MTASIYLDYNATTPLLPEVADAMRDVSLRYGANPGSAHAPGRQAAKALEDARDRIGELLGARMGGTAPDRVVLTSGGTEANHLALFGLLAPPGRATAVAPGRLVVSTIEHPSVAEPAVKLQQMGWQIDHLAVDKEGVAQVERLPELLKPETRLVALMLANNETGVVQPVAETAQIGAGLGIAVHTDAAQMVGKLPVDFRSLGVSSMACAAHKFHGPLGIGALVLRHEAVIQPTMFGGHQQGGLRPGTESVSLAVGMATALEHSTRDAKANYIQIAALRDRLQALILDAVPSARVLGQHAERLPNTLNLALADVDRQAMVMALDLEGIACSTGSACASGSSTLSPVLLAMGLSKAVCEGSFRLSLGRLTTNSDVDEAARRIVGIYRRLRPS